MTRDDRQNRVPSGDDASVNNGVYEVTRVTRVYNVTSNKMGHQEVEETKKDADIGDCARVKQTQSDLKEMHQIDHGRSSMEAK